MHPALCGRSAECRDRCRAQHSIPIRSAKLRDHAKRPKRPDLYESLQNRFQAAVRHTAAGWIAEHCLSQNPCSSRADIIISWAKEKTLQSVRAPGLDRSWLPAKRRKNSRRPAAPCRISSELPSVIRECKKGQRRDRQKNFQNGGCQKTFCMIYCIQLVKANLDTQKCLKTSPFHVIWLAYTN